MMKIWMSGSWTHALICLTGSFAIWMSSPVGRKNSLF
jgi:hypothetical protein